MTGPRRAAAEQRRDPRSRAVPRGEPEAVRVWLLGGFRVSVGTRTIGAEGWRLKKAGTLIKLLALATEHRMHREQAMELLWPGLDPEAALNNLHHTLHVARRTLEPAALASAASRYLHLRGELLALCPGGPLWVDVEAFEEAAGEARHAAVEPGAYRAAIEKVFPEAIILVLLLCTIVTTVWKLPSFLITPVELVVAVSSERRPSQKPTIGV
jgi:hypothetical protein